MKMEKIHAYMWFTTLILIFENSTQEFRPFLPKWFHLLYLYEQSWLRNSEIPLSGLRLAVINSKSNLFHCANSFYGIDSTCATIECKMNLKVSAHRLCKRTSTIFVLDTERERIRDEIRFYPTSRIRQRSKNHSNRIQYTAQLAFCNWKIVICLLSGQKKNRKQMFIPVFVYDTIGKHCLFCSRTAHIAVACFLARGIVFAIR